jgi:hypothetical protein
LVVLDDWRREADGTFCLRDQKEPGWVICPRDHLEVLHARPEFATAIKALRLDRPIAPQLDIAVGSAPDSSFRCSALTAIGR